MMLNAPQKLPKLLGFIVLALMFIPELIPRPRTMLLIGVAILLGGLLFCPVAQAADVEMRLSWEPPTTRVDGSPLDPATELSGYELACGGVVTQIPATVSGVGYPVPKAEALPGYGNYDCSMVAIDTDGRRSDPSKPVEVGWIAPPSAPTELIIFYGPD